MELVQQGLEDTVKLCLAIIPMVSDRHVRKDPTTKLEGMDIQAKMELNFVYKYLARDGDMRQHLSDPHWFPILGINERFPPTVVMTAEFDTFRGHAEELAENLQSREAPRVRVPPWGHARVLHGHGAQRGRHVLGGLLPDPAGVAVTEGLLVNKS